MKPREENLASEVAGFEKLVLALTLESGLFAAIVTGAFGVSGAMADVSRDRLSAWLVASVSVAVSLYLLAAGRLQPPSTGQPDQLEVRFRAELRRQAQLRRRAPFVLLPLVIALLFNAWVRSSVMSLMVVVVIGLGQWLNLALARGWRKRADAKEIGE